ncbi:hypothetical protein [Tunturiibacter lichenicola]|uniref:hypothetical protein n=1 Tax=Tunturiibacter lichenicola TaxID=2051959 RepID=UPI003D9BCBE3
MTIKTPHSPRISPQIHHQNTTFYTPFLPKPPAKTHIYQRRKKRRKNIHLPDIFLGRKREEAGIAPGLFA